MSTPCTQGPNIETIHTVLERLEADNARMIGFLRDIAEQGAFIKSLQENANRTEKALNNIFTRLRLLEVDNAGVKVRLAAIISISAVVASALTGVMVKYLP